MTNNLRYFSKLLYYCIVFLHKITQNDNLQSDEVSFSPAFDQNCTLRHNLCDVNHYSNYVYVHDLLYVC